MIPYKPRVLSLCSGIGCIDLAAQIAGCEIAGQVELDPFCRAVLAKHWPDVPRKNDIKEVQGNEFGTIDIVAGGIPCQPFSSAGKRRGVADDRHLWPFALTIIEEAQPTWALIENVRNFIPMALDLLLSDLASAGYEAGALVLPACAVGAPHIRERCFVLAHLSGERSGSRRTPSAGQQGQPDVDSHGAEMAHSSSAGWEEQYAPTISGTMGHPARRKIAPGRGMADAQHGGCERWVRGSNQPGATLRGGSAGTWAEPQSRMGGMFDGPARWLDGHIWPALPGQAQHESEPPRTIQGKLAYRNQRLKALGNGVVWQQIYPIFEIIMQYYAAFDR